MAKPTKKNRRGAATANSFRIIAGRLRGRRLSFAANDELRPTTDRLRETLFNWLQPHIAGAVVLDAFTGSGALALEAVSRGASEVVAWDRDAAAIRRLEEHANRLGLAAGQRLIAQSCDALQRLQAGGDGSPRFDIVLLDPPFRRDWWPAIFTALQGGWLQSGALVYIEFEKDLQLPELPASWQLYRQTSAGQVCAALFRCSVQ